jgi:hypothetical protein
MQAPRKRGRPPIDDSAALDAMADYSIADPSLTVTQLARKVMRENPHLIAPSKKEKSLPQ